MSEGVPFQMEYESQHKDLDQFITDLDSTLTQLKVSQCPTWSKSPLVFLQEQELCIELDSFTR